MQLDAQLSTNGSVKIAMPDGAAITIAVLPGYQAAPIAQPGSGNGEQATGSETSGVGILIEVGSALASGAAHLHRRVAYSRKKRTDWIVYCLNPEVSPSVRSEECPDRQAALAKAEEIARTYLAEGGTLSRWT